MHEIRFKEPAWIWLLFAGSFGLFWPVMWGVVPFLAGDGIPSVLRVVFPLIGLFGAAIGWGMAAKVRGAGFRLTVMGIEGAADSELTTVPWSQVRSLAFQLDPSMRVNDVPVKRLVAHLTDGSVLRVSSLGVASTDRWAGQIEQARAAGILPATVDVVGPASMDAYGRAAAELRALTEAGVDPQDVLEAAREIRRRRLEAENRRRDGWVEDTIDDRPG